MKNGSVFPNRKPNRFYIVSMDLFLLFKSSIIGAVKSFSER